jgi:peptidyl-tRNA hydrolase, PTH1 family
MVLNPSAARSQDGDLAGGSAEGEGPWLVVGLGNPGTRYAGNRHNIGAMVLDRLVARLRERFGSHRSGAQLAEARLAPVQGRPGPRVLLARPTSYMNVSGQQVGALAGFFRVPVARLLVVHDELDIPFGQLRLKRGGGEGGHNGLRSITAALGGRDYARLRLGIGRPPGRMDPADFVLRDFPRAERAEVDLLVELGADAVEDVLTRGWDRAQNLVNTREDAR